MIDAHFHLDKSMQELMIRHKINGIVNVANKKQYEEVIAFKKQYEDIAISVGIHPWDVEQVLLSEMEELFEKSDAIGEIGLDCVWCKCDFKHQYEVFEKQLQIAQQLNKPVIIHMMGYEQEVLTLIRKYSNRYLIHWVKPHFLLTEFIKLGCYFSVAYDYDEEVIKQIPNDKLLVESDGLESLKWLNIDINHYEINYNKRLKMIACIKKQSILQIKQQIIFNFNTFLNK